MKRGHLCLLLAVTLSTLSISVPAQDVRMINTQASQSQDDYAFRLAFFVVEKIERSTGDSSTDPLVTEVRKLLEDDKQRQIRTDLERRIGPPGSPERDTKYDRLLSEIDEKLSDRKISELRDELSKRGQSAIARWRWPLCVITGCR